jgi:hypothetical protein
MLLCRLVLAEGVGLCSDEWSRYDSIAGSESISVISRLELQVA